MKIPNLDAIDQQADAGAIQSSAVIHLLTNIIRDLQKQVRQREFQPELKFESEE